MKIYGGIWRNLEKANNGTCSKLVANFKIRELEYNTKPYPDAACASPPLPNGRGILFKKGNSPLVRGVIFD